MADPEDGPDPVAGVYRRPFSEQVAFFRRKLGNLVPTRRWDDMIGAEHDNGFMVAGAMKADLLTDLAAAVDKAIAEGTGLDAFRKDFEAIVARNGWTGYTGSETLKGRAWRVSTIYLTNLRTSYAAGRHAQLVAGDFNYWVYFHGASQEPRPEHLSWNGIALKPNDDFWATHYPPSDWGCSCYVVGANTPAGVKRLGGDPDKKLPANWRKIDTRTGAPIGIGRGWDYAPGARVSDTVRAMAGKVGSWDYGVAKAFMSGLEKPYAEALSQAYRQLPSTEDDARRLARAVFDPELPAPRSAVRSLGMVPDDHVDEITQLTGKAIDRPDFRMTSDFVAHVRNSHTDPLIEASRQQRPVTPEDFARLPLLLSVPDAIERPAISAAGETLVHYIRRFGDEQYVAVLAVKRGYRTLDLKTFYVKRGKTSPQVQRP